MDCQLLNHVDGYLDIIKTVSSYYLSIAQLFCFIVILMESGNILRLMKRTLAG
jgi:hypothetical protein